VTHLTWRACFDIVQPFCGVGRATGWQPLATRASHPVPSPRTLCGGSRCHDRRAPAAGGRQAARRRFAADLFSHAWTLLGTPSRTLGQGDETLHAADASRYRWGEIGQPVNLARGEWQCSRVHAVLGRAEPALSHARRCPAICEANGIAGWNIAAAHEALARAHLFGGELDAVATWKAKAYHALAPVAGS
jgi:hypothetical protein